MIYASKLQYCIIITTERALEAQLERPWFELSICFNQCFSRLLNYRNEDSGKYILHSNWMRLNVSHAITFLVTVCMMSRKLCHAAFQFAIAVTFTFVVCILFTIMRMDLHLDQSHFIQSNDIQNGFKCISNMIQMHFKSDNKLSLGTIHFYLVSKTLVILCIFLRRI